MSELLQMLKTRARMLQGIRAFFMDKKVMEVETPLLYHSTNTDPYLDSFTFVDGNKKSYLQTSPELPMKRLLAAGSGDIYHLNKAFRLGEKGKWHNPEFTMLEWYRCGFSLDELIAEVAALIDCFIPNVNSSTITYQQLFEEVLNFNPHQITLTQLQIVAAEKMGKEWRKEPDKNVLLDLLMSHYIEPNLGVDELLFVTEQPIEQSAMAKAKVNDKGFEVAERFEVYYQGIELANGYCELQNVEQQRARIINDNKKRQYLGKDIIAVDELFLQALPNLPDCAGVALGVDRLQALMLGKEKISSQLFIK